MNWKPALLAAACVLPLLIILALGFNHDPHAVPSVLEGKPAPDFTLARDSGGPLTLSQLRGKPVVINFWATWCYPCKAEHQDLQAVAAHYADRVQFLGVVYQDSAENAHAYLQTTGSLFPQLLDPESRTAIDFGVAGVPESFIINAAGTVVYKQAGVCTAELLRRKLDAVLAGLL